MFEAPFWIGVYERFDDGYYEVCKITFGSEPKDYEVYDFLLKNWNSLKFSPPIKSEIAEERKINPIFTIHHYLPLCLTFRSILLCSC